MIEVEKLGTLLAEAPAFRQLPGAQQARILEDWRRVMSFITARDGGIREPAIRAASGGVRSSDRSPVAHGLGDEVANQDLHKRLAKQQNLVGKDFKGGATKELVDQYGKLVSAVDFPKFVSGLIEGVYTSIVNSSIRQMQEYGKLLEAVVKSVEEFAQDHISPDAARSYLVSSFPGAVETEEDDHGRRRIRLKEDLDDQDIPDFQKSLAMLERIELNEENEERIVLAAQLKMARQRQQQLATMVMLGINRIVVTEGEIKASVLFDMKSKDTARRDTFASTSDTVTTQQQESTGWWGSLWGDDSSSTRTTVSTAYSEEKEQSTATLEAKAKLSGSVLVRFKSETFPLERVSSPMELDAVRTKSSRADAPRAAGGGPAGAAAAPAATAPAATAGTGKGA